MLRLYSFLKRLRVDRFFWEGSAAGRFFFCVVAGGVILLGLRLDYCIFSTLPLDVENTVIQTQKIEGGIVCSMLDECAWILRMNVLYFLHAAA